MIPNRLKDGRLYAVRYVKKTWIEWNVVEKREWQKIQSVCTDKPPMA